MGAAAKAKNRALESLDGYIVGPLVTKMEILADWETQNPRSIARAGGGHRWPVSILSPIIA